MRRGVAVGSGAASLRLPLSPLPELPPVIQVLRGLMGLTDQLSAIIGVQLVPGLLRRRDDGMSRAGGAMVGIPGGEDDAGADSVGHGVSGMKRGHPRGGDTAGLSVQASHRA